MLFFYRGLKRKLDYKSGKMKPSIDVVKMDFAKSKLKATFSVFTFYFSVFK